MKKMLEQLCAGIDAGEDFVLATTVGHSGSTPRQAGARMIVRRDGRIMGTIGGGPVEATAVREAATVFAAGRTLRRSFNLSHRDAAAAGMICGGEMELVMEHVAPNPDNRAIFGLLLAAVRSGRRSTLVSWVSSGQNGAQWFVVDSQGGASRTDVAESLLAVILRTRTSSPPASLVEHQDQTYLLNTFKAGGTVYLVGAGHVSACTAEAAARVGFRVAVMDDRPEFASRDRFPQADEIRVLPSFADCFDDVQLDHDSYLVIATRGHLYDMEVLDQALRTGAGYIGMIGSCRKRNSIYAKLIDRGVSQAQLDQVRCPIGLAIEADTPEEIAVAIVGELIHQRASGERK